MEEEIKGGREGRTDRGTDGGWPNEVVIGWKNECKDKNRYRRKNRRTDRGTNRRGANEGKKIEEGQCHLVLLLWRMLGEDEG